MITLIKSDGALSFLKTQAVPKLPTIAEDTAPKYETNLEKKIYMQAFNL